MTDEITIPITETIYNVDWEGPFDWNDAKVDDVLEHHLLYQLYGPHPVYGSHVLLYIGSSFRLRDRFGEHEADMELSAYRNNISAHIGSVGPFTSWANWLNTEGHAKVGEDLLKQIEALLIFAHQPALNTKNLWNAYSAKGLRIFNTGKYGDLIPEVSYLYCHLE